MKVICFKPLSTSHLSGNFNLPGAFVCASLQPGTSSRFAPYILFIYIKVCLFFFKAKNVSRLLRASLSSCAQTFCLCQTSSLAVIRYPERSRTRKLGGGIKAVAWCVLSRGIILRTPPALWNFQCFFSTQTFARRWTQDSSAAAHLPSNEFESRCIFKEVTRLYCQCQHR